jgi:hypothetical protein
VILSPVGCGFMLQRRGKWVIKKANNGNWVLKEVVGGCEFNQGEFRYHYSAVFYMDFLACYLANIISVDEMRNLLFEPPKFFEGP